VQDKPKCPSAKRVKELARWLRGIVTNYPNRDQFISADHAEIEVIEALEWLANFLDDRALYHKRQQLKNKHLLRLAKEHGLLDNDVKQVVEAELVDHVLKGEPDDD